MASGIKTPKTQNKGTGVEQGRSSDGSGVVLDLVIPMEVQIVRPTKDGGVKVVTEGNPIPKSRARQVFQNGKVHSYNSPRTQAAEDYLRVIFSQHKEKCREFVKVWVAGKKHGREFKQYVPLKITLWCYFIKREWIPDSIIIPTLRKLGDVDNHLKICLDAMTDVLIADDCQITSASVIKRWSDKNSGYIRVVLERDMGE